MSGNDTTIIVAQASNGDALQNGTVVSEASSAPAPAEHTATTTAHTEVEHEVFPPFDPSTFGNQLIWLAVAFAILYVVVSRAALPRIGGILEARRARIDGDLKEADRLRKETEKAVANYEKALADARLNASKIAAETRQSIQDDIAGKRSAVEADLGARTKEAEARIEVAKTAALGNVDSIAADTARALVNQLLGDNAASEAEALAAVSQAKGAI